jgi:hypothetical protein
MALAGVGFSRVVVWLEGCIIGRPGESKRVVAEVVGLDGAKVVGLDGAEVGDYPT